MKRLAIFDFDGTLVDSELSLIEVYKEGFAAINETCSPEQAREYMHHSLKEVIVERKIIEEKRIILFVKTVIEAIDNENNLKLIKPYPEVENVLKTLQNHNFNLAIVTGNSKTHVEKVLKQYGLYHYFEYVVDSIICSVPKPAPDPLLMCLDHFPDVKKEGTFYVGDSLQDIESAKDAGIDGYLLERKNEYPSFAGRKFHDLEAMLKNIALD